MRRARGLLAVAIAIGSAVVTGDAEAAPPALSFDDVVRIAESNPPAVLAALARRDAADADRRIARAAYLPSVAVSSSPNLAYANRPFLPGLRYEGLTASIDATLSIRWTLYDFGRTGAAVRGADQGVVAAGGDASDARQSAVIDAATRYLGVAAAKAIVANARDLLAARQSELRVVHDLVASGIRPAVDEVRTRLDVDGAQLDVVRADAHVRSEEASLLAALGLDPAQAIATTSPLDAGVRGESDSAMRAADRAMSRAGAVIAADARVAQSEASLDAARAARLPTLAFNASGSTTHTEIEKGAGLGGLANLAQGGIALSWTLFDPAVSGAIAKAEKQHAAAGFDAAATRTRVRLEAANAATDVESARAALSVADDQVAQAEVNLDLVRGRYKQGLGTLYDVLDAQFGVERARGDRVNVHLTLAVASIKLVVLTEGTAAVVSRPR